jgi:hypothetical protein
MIDELPDWVLIEAAKRAGINRTPAQIKAGQLSNSLQHIFAALCEMILQHEQPPVDRKVLCAQEASRQSGEQAGWEHSLNLCIRAIELWEEGFGR